MKVIKNNRGTTLVELIVCLAILSLIMVGVIGTMTSNTTVYRKSKQDIGVQNTALNSFNQISDSLEQAVYVYAEGYTVTDASGKDVTGLQFKASKVGKDYSLGGNTLKFMKLVSKNVYDKNTNDDKTDDIRPETGVAYTGSDTPWKSDTSFTSFDDLNKNGTINFYITKLVVKYAVPYNSVFLGSGTAPSDKVDYVTQTYTFDKNQIKLTSSYDAMKNENTKSGTLSADIYESPDLLASEMNYMNVPNGSSTVSLPGAVTTFDPDRNSLTLKLYFADRNKSFTSDGVIDVKNSYVLKKEN